MNLNTVEAGFRPTDDGRCAVGARGMIATQSAQATEAGWSMLEAGGNAVDAAVAAAFVLGVTEPQASGLGGQTMMLVGRKEGVIAVDGSSRAPSLAHSSAIYKRDRSVGYRAATVPSTPATLAYVHRCYGQLPWQAVLEPAIVYADSGYTITRLQQRLLAREQQHFEQVDSQSGLKRFFKNGEPYQEGEVFKQPELARVLRRLADKGVEEFYRGTIAKEIDADMRQNGGLLRYDDLAFIPYPIEREPLVKPYRGLEIYTMPPPGSGRTLLFALMMIDMIPLDRRIEDEATRYLLFVRILRKALLERSDRPFDPNFFPQIAGDADMLDPAYSRECLAEILRDVDRSILPFIPSEDELSGETTHLSVMDEAGMAVSLTQSIERVYGSKAVAEGLGFLYNNYLCDFDYNLPEHPFYLRPNAVPWATVSPTVVFHEGQVWMAVGSPGSERVISTLALFLQRVADYGMSIDQAMQAPRIHCSLGGRVSLEVGRFAESLVPFLERKGFRVDPREDHSFYLGCIQAVVCRHDGKGFQGVADVRRDGAARGLG
ncbi:MAG: gamma-glutamyltransferase [Phycisphaerales bacterium]|nr:MAG: gamma-glutamyltransferase [Phycisphaerales bacterium]